MGWSDKEGRCKKHPKHTQSPGVCSFCLREKLSQLSSSSNNTVSGSCSSSTVSSYSSVSASSASPPPLHLTLGRRISLPVTAAEGMFGRSRSMAVAVGRDGEGGTEKKKKGGFWSKLLGVKGRRRKEEGFLHSKTMKEVVAANSALSRK